jgi:nitrite reductase/ring-hydroxylating ferredoxin subunit
VSDERERSKRLNSLITELLSGRRLRLGPGDTADQGAIRVAAHLAAAFQNSPWMSPAFRRRLRARLGNAEAAPRRLTRRRVLLTGAAGMGTLVGGLLGGAGARLTERPLGTPVSRAGEAINPVAGRWLDVAALTDLTEGEAFRAKAGAVGAFLFRRADRVTAVSSICSHMPCELRWMPGQAVLQCPCHPSTFTSDGHSTATISPLPDLSRVLVRVENGRVLVRGT